MARYIDADKLNKDVLVSWDKDNHYTIEASRVHRQEHHHLMRIIEKQPTADVAPKSENATEIFAEFEKILRLCDTDGCLKVTALYSDYAELKKKYTEGKT